MKKITIISFCIFILLCNKSSAQDGEFVSSGIIEFEKSINMNVILKKNWEGRDAALSEFYINRYKQTGQPQFKILKSTLSFSNGNTLFAPQNVVDPYASSYENSRPLVEQNNVVYTDLTTDNCVTKKTVFEETYLVKDHVKNINWKITAETREIAGYTCRRANGIMMDSIYVVAFYTGEIPVSGGPESFSGLPGMILGVALPHENITWFAKNVVPATVPPTNIKAPVPAKKTKVVTIKELKGILESSSLIKQLSKAYMQLYLKGFML